MKTDDAVGSTEIGYKIAKLDEVQEVFYIAGEYNYLIKARVSDTDNLRELLKKLGDLGGVKDTRTTLVINELLETLNLGLNSIQVKQKNAAKNKR